MRAQSWVSEIYFPQETAARWKAYIHDFSGVLDLAEDALQMQDHGVTVKVIAPSLRTADIARIRSDILR